MYSPSFPLKGYASQSTIEGILKTARKKGLRGIAITDHNTIKGSLNAAKTGKKYGIVAVPSVEVHSKQGHILAYNIAEPIKKRMDFGETIEKIHDQGGLAVCAHPLLKIMGVGKKRIKFFDGIECINAREWKILPKSLLGKKQFMVAGTDAHTLKEIGNVVTVFQEDFSNAEEMMELLRKMKSSFKRIKKTSKIKDIILPQIKNMTKYHADLARRKVVKP